jgi:hypothetical protein
MKIAAQRIFSGSMTSRLVVLQSVPATLGWFLKTKQPPEQQNLLKYLTILL